MVKNISAKEAQKLVEESEAILVDVRPTDEFKQEHIDCAISVPSDVIAEKLPKLAKGKKIILQCNKGGRATRTCELEGDKFPDNEVINLEGGIQGWKDAGLPVIGDNAGGAGISIFRQVQMIAGALILLFILLDLEIISAIIGVALLFAGASGWCGLAMLLAKMPWNSKR